MKRTQFILLWLLTVALLPFGCSKVAPEQRALAEYNRGEFADAIRICESIIDDSRDEQLVYETQVLKGTCLINLANVARKSRDEDSAIRYLEQAVNALTTAIEFRQDDPEAFYQRAIAYEMLGNNTAHDNDTFAAKAIDPEHKTAYTNEFIKRDTSRDVAIYEIQKDMGETREQVPLGILAEKDESEPTPKKSNDPFAEGTDRRDDPYALDNAQDPWEVDPNGPSEDEDEESRPRNGFANGRPSEEELDSERDPILGPADPNGEQGGAPARRSRRRSSIATKTPNNLDPLEPPTPDEETDGPPGHAPYEIPYRPRPATPFQPPSTGVTGNHSRLQPGFNPNLPTTGYSGGPLGGVAPSGPMQSAPSTGLGGLANGPLGPTTGYSGNPYPMGSGYPSGNRNRVPGYSALPRSGGMSSGIANGYNASPLNGGFEYSGALPFSERAKFGRDGQPLTTPYQAPPRAPNPYLNVPQAKTLNDFYTPPAFQPHSVPTTSMYGK